MVALAIATYGVGAVGASLVTGGWTPLVGIGVLLGTACSGLRGHADGHEPDGN